MREMSPSERAGPEGGKRARLACLNCRRKKVRCSGRQPVCDLCRRLSQRCQYTARGECPPRTAGQPDGTHFDRVTMDQLRDRMDMIEGRLEDIVNMLSTQYTAPTAGASVDSPSSSTISSRQVDLEPGSDRFRSPPRRSQPQPDSISFDKVPSLELLLPAADLYFKYCHNQPYAVFHEQTFRENLATGTMPTHLLLAFYATAIRFSSEPHFHENRHRAIDGYATESWKSILLLWNGLETVAEISTVQAILLLGIIDYTAGRCQGAWIKIGLGIRIAHHLQLMKEPPSHLPPSERESPTIVDQVCELQLPCSEEAFQKGEDQNMPSLDEIASGKINMIRLGCSPVALLVILSSILGQCAQSCLKEYKQPQELPPWDSRSKFSNISSFLLRAEQQLCSTSSLVPMVQRDLVEAEVEVEYCRTGPLVYAHCLFHVGRCLLYHPFLMAQRLACLNEEQAPPLSFLEHALHLYKSHAQALTASLEEVKNAGYYPPSSFYAFFNTTAGVAHAILTQSDDARAADDAKSNFDLCLNNLASMTERWGHAALMIPVLDKALAMSGRLRGLLYPSQMRSLSLNPEEVAFLWETVDNTCLSSQKDQRFYYQASKRANEAPADGARVDHHLNLSAFGTTITDELFDIDSLISLGILSPNMAQQLALPVSDVPISPSRPEGNSSRDMTNAPDIFSRRSGLLDTPDANPANAAPMSSQTISTNSSFNPNFSHWTTGTSMPASSFRSSY